MSLIGQLIKGSKAFVNAFRVPGEPSPISDELGTRSTPENQLKALSRGMWVDPTLRAAILDIRTMDRLDGRVKRIHAKVAGDTVRGGLVLVQKSTSAVIRREWDAFSRRLQLNRASKLRSDARTLVMQGNLAMQWVLDDARNVVLGVAMPAETLIANSDAGGRFKDVRRAYSQVDMIGGSEIAAFPLWKLTLARLDPDNYDDVGSMGRPWLDAGRGGWQKLSMTEEDLVIRRRTRAPQKLSHVLEGAAPEELAAYRQEVERNANDIQTDFYSNKKGGVTVLQGDAQMGEIKDVQHLLDTWFAVSPVPKFMLGYTDSLARDVLEDLRRGYFDDIDYLQDEQSFVYDQGFQLHLLLKGIDPMDAGYQVMFAERRTETSTQTADRMLKWQALGIPQSMTYTEMGLDPEEVKRRRTQEAAEGEPYPGGDGDDQSADGNGVGGDDEKPKIKITPGNGRKGDSGTSITQ